MKLRVTFELPLSTESEPYLDMIAKIHGYSPIAYPDSTAQQFVCSEICVPQVGSLFESIIVNAVSAYLGISGQEQVKAVRAQYLASRSVVADIVAD